MHSPLLLSSYVLAQSAPRSSWAPVVLLLLIGIGFAVGNVVISVLIGPSRTGPGKETTYESGMVPVGDTHRRFNVRFYLVAILFILFDLETVFLFPWAATFRDMSYGPGKVLLLFEVLAFVLVLAAGLFYVWKRRGLEWE